MDVEGVEEEMDEEMDDPPSQNNDLLVPAHMIVASHTLAFIQQYTSAPISTPSTSATPVAPAPPPPPPPSVPLPPPSIPLPPPNHTHSEEAAVTLALENYVKRKMLRKKYGQPNHVQHRGGKVPAAEGVRKGKAKEQREKKALPAGAPSVSTPASLPARAIAPAPPSSASAPLRSIAPGPAPAAAVVAAPRTTPPTHRALPQAQVPAPTTAAPPRPPSPIFLAPAPGSSPSIVVKDEKMDDQSLEGEKEKDDGDSDTPTTILPPRRRVLESKARLACLFCRGRKIACKAAVVGFGESGANGACK
jgi:hypothetical protein